MVIDLHTHSTASDGALAPKELVEAALAAGVTMLALTDHDTLAGFDAVRESSAAEVNVIAGIEFSVCWTRRDVHLVGLDFDPDAPAIRAAVTKQQQARHQRAEKIAARLQRRGLPDLLAGATDIAGGVPGRVHFARCLVNGGHVPDLRRAFKRYLGDGKPADARGNWLSLEAAVSLIRAAGGQPVLAHPLGYGLTKTALTQLVTDFHAAGGTALEWSASADRPDLSDRLLRLIRTLDLLVSSGSDFHSPVQSWRRLGGADPLPAGLTGVWTQFRAPLTPLPRPSETPQ